MCWIFVPCDWFLPLPVPSAFKLGSRWHPHWICKWNWRYKSCTWLHSYSYSCTVSVSSGPFMSPNSFVTPDFTSYPFPYLVSWLIISSILFLRNGNPGVMVFLPHELGEIQIQINLIICFFFFLMATPLAYGNSQARSGIRATAASLHHRHSNSGSKLCL